jgi:CRP-like cAMP-binding protein
MLVAVLGAGDIVGEIAVRYPELRRNATATTLSPSRVLVLDPAEFRAVMNDFPAVGAAIDETAQARQSRHARAPERTQGACAPGS